MSATEYRVDLRDIRFVLLEQLDLAGTLGGFERYAAFDAEIYDSTLTEAAKIAEEVLAPLNAKSDQIGCSFDGKGNVTTPPGFVEAWKTTADGGWLALAAPEEHGGMGMPNALGSAVGEMWTAACPSLSVYTGLARGAASLLAEYAPESLRGLCVEKLYSGAWGGTMCLTEAGAGSDVGANRAKATPTDREGVYLLEGEKVFISGGDHDVAENIVHLVLARAPGAAPGTKGLSIFLVPKFNFDADGDLGERNGAFVVGIEEKMGIHGSVTCTLALGADRPCEGILLGSEGDGMHIMFHMMNEERIAVGIQGLSISSAAYGYAVSYAKDRLQGSDLSRMREADPPSVSIIQHPDVRRMLMMQKVQIEAMRSLLYTTALRLDRAYATDDADQAAYLRGLVDLMTPICKAHCSDVGFDCAVLALQTFGGYGYIREYPVEQAVRDAKIASIYEGTNGIQAMDLLGRKMRQGGGALFMAGLSEANAEIDRCKEAGVVPDAVAALEKARDVLGATAMHLGMLGGSGNIKGAMLQASPFLTQFGTVVCGLHSLWQARVASAKLAAGAQGEDARFYKGKVLNAQFYAANLLSRATALGKSIQAADESCLDESLFG